MFEREQSWVPGCWASVSPRVFIYSLSLGARQEIKAAIAEDMHPEQP